MNAFEEMFAGGLAKAGPMVDQIIAECGESPEAHRGVRIAFGVITNIGVLTNIGVSEKMMECDSRVFETSVALIINGWARHPMIAPMFGTVAE